MANAKKIKGVDAFGDGGYKWVYEDKIRKKKLMLLYTIRRCIAR